tara:strand:- start:5771 stop:6811 length:1041 start_codon:yes stop_codon:yes gene_type:complete
MSQGPESLPKGGSGPGDAPFSEGNSFSIKCGAQFDAEGVLNGEYTYTVDPGWVTSERPIVSGNPSTGAYTAIMPTLGGDRLDADTPPSPETSGALTVLWAKHSYDAYGVLTSVAIESGLELPEGGGSISADDYREIGKIELVANASGTLEPVVTQYVESDYYWPGKVALATVTEEFHQVSFTPAEDDPDCCKIVLRRFLGEFISVNEIIDEDVTSEWIFAKCAAGYPTDGYPEVIEVAYSGSIGTSEGLDAFNAIGLYDRVRPEAVAGVPRYMHREPTGNLFTRDLNEPASYDWSMGSGTSLFYNTAPDTEAAEDSVTGDYNWNSVDWPHGGNPFTAPTLQVTDAS